MPPAPLDWFTTEIPHLLAVALTVVGMYAALIASSRLSGLRSFSKMSAFDFVGTVAFGSVLASVVLNKDPPLLLGVFGLAMLFLMQKILAHLRMRVAWFSALVDNTPTMLMYKGAFLRDNMRRCEITEEDVIAKLREANALNFGQIHAVVFETTGDISVLHAAKDSGEEFDERLLKGVSWGAEPHGAPPSSDFKPGDPYVLP